MAQDKIRMWVGLGSYVLASAAVPAFSAGEQPSVEGAPVLIAEAKPGGDGGEGGEGGEGGVSAEEAARDPAAYLLALDVMAAHYLAGRDAYAAGRTDAASEMFVHPISEIYIDLEPVLAGRGVAPFQQEMEAAAELASKKAARQDVERAAGLVLGSLRAAAGKAPAPGAADVGVGGRVVGDLVDRSAQQYAVAAKSKDLEPYLDGYGLYLAAKVRADELLPRIDGEAAVGLRKLLENLARAYPSVMRPQSLALEPSAVMSQAARVRLLLSSLE